MFPPRFVSFTFSHYTTKISLSKLNCLRFYKYSEKNF